jgi:hypothetical protein
MKTSVDQYCASRFAVVRNCAYLRVVSGGSGCVPPLPPREYWSWKYQTAEGQAKVAAWFDGFTYGAQAADEEGAGMWQDIQVSHLIEAQYSPEFQRGECPPRDVHPAPRRAGYTIPPQSA